MFKSKVFLVFDLLASYAIDGNY
ncbi:uncharacterized protein METZ01_LOCUS295460 [marine metagenome]|uniref:Uncharacterized protein n=1 Tax=marine metagenome TaxID=408172 RepID=A0A382M162_9ZZZZ